MIDLFPGPLPGPINQIFIAVILVTCAFSFASSDKRMRWGGLALVLSQFMAVFATLLMEPVLTAPVLGLCALMCVYGGGWILRVVAILYVARTINVGLYYAEYIPFDLMWAWTEPFLALQILIILGNSIYGKGHYQGSSLNNSNTGMHVSHMDSLASRISASSYWRRGT